jgi:eukaryotic-like serine/threonine-protein kinase
MVLPPADHGPPTTRASTIAGAGRQGLQVKGPLRRVGPYQLIAPIASGRIAEFLLARQGELAGFRMPLMIKRLRPGFAADPRFVQAFLEDSRIAAMLDHPNVVRLYEVGHSAGEVFVAMELVQGKALASLIRRAAERRETLSHRLAAMVVAQAAAGLHHAHGLSDQEGRPLGFVHRDLSPQKILVSFEGAVKVIDFAGGSAVSRLAGTRAAGGTGRSAYLSPEQASAQDIDHRTDIFALGCVLWEAVCGRPLFARDSEAATIRAVLEAPIPAPSTITTVAPALEAIIMRALDRAPPRRFQSAHDLASELERHVSKSGGGGTPELGALMKTYFAADQVAWRNTVRVALTAEREEDLSQVRDLKMSHTGLQAVPEATLAIPATPRPARRWPLAVLALAALLLLSALAITGLDGRARTASSPAPAPSRPVEAMGPPPVPAPRDRQGPPVGAPAPVAPRDGRTYPGPETDAVPSRSRGPERKRHRSSSPPDQRPATGHRRPNPF